MLHRALPPITLLVALLFWVATARAAGAPQSSVGGVSIVQLAAPPVAVALERPGRRLDVDSPATETATSRLDDAQARALRAADVPAGAVRASYRLAFAGFAARLTAAQAAALRADPRIAAIEPNVALQPDANISTPPALALGGPAAAQSAQLLGLPDGMWARLGGPLAAGGAGSGQVVGVIDTGLDPDIASVAAQSQGGANFLGDDFPPPPASFRGACQAAHPAAPASAAFACSHKVVGARWYLTSASNPPAGSVLSPRDSDGHGTHTATTAAGNYGVDPAFGPSDLDVDVISGIAPRAHIATYKVCWPTIGCPTAETLQAFDDAVADGVSAINFSIGTPTTGVPNATAYAILGAQAAGVPVAQSAGNAGPGANTVGVSTANWWALAVGATTGAGSTVPPVAEDPFRGDNRTRAGTLHLVAADVRYRGASVTPRYSTDATGPVVDSQAYAASGAAALDTRLCRPGSLRTVPAGATVVCERGSDPIAEKAQAVAAVGGARVVLVNSADNLASLSQGSGTLPMLVLSSSDGANLRGRIANAGGAPSARFKLPVWAPTTPDLLAGFSSRGPTVALDSVMPVAVTAPGFDVLAGWPKNVANSFPAGVPVGSGAPGFGLLSGTSMASPHVAGTLALLRQSHPSWTPDQLRSALVTTGRPVRLAPTTGNGATPDADLYARGGGRIDPQRADEAGLLLSESADAYRAAGRGADPEHRGADLGPVGDPAQLNVPYVVLDDVPGTQTVRRTFSNPGATASTWSVATTAAPAGWSLNASPPSVTVAPGESATVTVTASFAPSTMPAPGTSALVLTEQGAGGRAVSLPIGLAPITARTTPKVHLETVGPNGSGAVPTRQQASSWNATPSTTNLTPLTTVDSHAFSSGACTFDGKNETEDNHVKTFEVAAGTRRLIAQTANLTGPSGANSDIDLFLYAPGAAFPTLRAETLSGLEFLEVESPATGTWTAVVLSCSPQTGYDLQLARVGTDPGHPTTLSPSATTGVGVFERFTPMLSWTGLPADGLYVAVVSTGTGPNTTVFVRRRPEPSPDAAIAVLDVGPDATQADVPFVGSADPNGAHTWARVEYGPTTQYGRTTSATPLGSDTGLRSFVRVLEDIPADVAWHARLVLERRDQVVARGADIVVRVRRAPVVQTLAPESVTSGAAVLHGALDPNAVATTGEFSFGPQGGTRSIVGSTAIGSGDATVPYSATVSGLSPATTYQYQAQARREGNVIAQGPVVTFTTPAATPTPSVSPSPTASAFPTATASAAPTATASVFPTATASASPGASATPAPGATRTPTPTGTPVPGPDDAAAEACATHLRAGRSTLKGVAVTTNRRTINTVVRAKGTRLRGVNVSLHHPFGCGTPVESKRMGKISKGTGKRAIFALPAPLPAGTYVLVADGKRAGRNLRTVLTVRLG